MESRKLLTVLLRYGKGLRWKRNQRKALIYSRKSVICLLKTWYCILLQIFCNYRSSWCSLLLVSFRFIWTKRERKKCFKYRFVKRRRREFLEVTCLFKDRCQKVWKWIVYRPAVGVSGGFTNYCFWWSYFYLFRFGNFKLKRYLGHCPYSIGN